MPFVLTLTRGFRARRWRKLDRAGVAAVEFAIIGPVLVLMLMGVFTYGGYFLTAQTIQQLANDSARAAIAGLDDSERRAIAENAMRDGIAAQDFLRGDLAAVDITRDGDVLAVRVTYDARDDLYWSFKSLVPVPSPLIRRTASIRLGGL